LLKFIEHCKSFVIAVMQITGYVLVAAFLAGVVSGGHYDYSILAIQVTIKVLKVRKSCVSHPA